MNEDDNRGFNPKSEEKLIYIQNMVQNNWSQHQIEALAPQAQPIFKTGESETQTL